MTIDENDSPFEDRGARGDKEDQGAKTEEKKNRKKKKKRNVRADGKKRDARILRAMVFLRQRHIAPSYVIHY